jgi:hypothetical protein
MNVLDEDIDLYQRQRLEAKKIHVRQIGVEIGRAGMKDRNGVIPALHALRRPTFFTRDHGFYHPDSHTGATNGQGRARAPQRAELVGSRRPG